jgi:outer membrane protein assembly factor BamB
MAAVVALGGGAALAQGADPWPMAGRNPAHQATIEGPDAPYRKAWSTEIEGGPVAGPVVAGDAVVVVAEESTLAVAPDTGERLWEWPRTPGPAGPAAISGDLVIHASGTGPATALVARRLSDGGEVWRAFAGSAAPGGLTVAGGSVFTGTRQGVVLAFDAETGEERWRFEADGAVETAPAVSGGLVLVASQSLSTGRATVYALDAAAGAESGPVWRFTPQPVPSAFPSSVTAGDGVAFVGTSDGSAWGLDLESGAQRWSTEVRDVFSPRQVPAAMDGGVVIADRSHLYRFDASGEEQWVFRLADLRELSGDRTNSLAASSPAVSGGVVLIGDASGTLSAIDVETARRVWRKDLGPGPIGAVAASEERVYVVSQGESGSLVAMESDPDGVLLDEVSPTVLFPGRALLNYALAFLGVGAVIVGLFRFLLRGRNGAGAEQTSS